MVNTSRLAEIASLVGDPSRAAMLSALMDDRALTATELANEASITPQTASTHLSQLVTGQLLRVEKHGRHRLHRLASAEVARMLEGILQIAVGTEVHERSSSSAESHFRSARTCYDHLAGRLGVAIADKLVGQGAVELSDEAALLTQDGVEFLNRLGIAAPNGCKGQLARPICKPCLDWTERRLHIGGKLGTAILAHCLQSGWVRRTRGSRALETTLKGQLAFRKHFGIVF